MAKASGNTRAKYPTNRERGGGNKGVSDSQYQSVVNAIAKNDMSNHDVWEQLSQEQQELALMQAGFTGAISDDLTEGTMYVPTSKNDMVTQFVESLVNEMQGYGIKDEFYTVLYKDGSKKYLDELTNDFGNANITDKMYKQAYTNAKNALQLSKVAAIIKSDAFDQPRYYVAKGGEQQMRNYGFEFWEKEKGEKERNYIQGEWI